MWDNNEIYKTRWPYMGPRLCQQDARPSAFFRNDIRPLVAFGSIAAWRQLAGYIYGFQDYVNND